MRRWQWLDVQGALRGGCRTRGSSQVLESLVGRYLLAPFPEAHGSNRAEAGLHLLWETA